MTLEQPFRRSTGGRIDRSHTLSFTFNECQYAGYEGDTVASALLANGVRVVNRSFKFHRPRGILSAGVEEPNALFAVDAGSGWIPLVRATLMPLSDGMRVEAQSGYPHLGFDLLRILDFTRALWPAGFYNKTFKWPGWHAYEGVIRRMAGLGRLPMDRRSVRYTHQNAHCEVLVVGAGPAGLAAARAAASRGEDVILVDQQLQPGGSLLHASWHIDGKPSAEWLDKTIGELADYANVRIMLGSTVTGYFDHGVLTIHDRSAAYRGDQSVESFWKVRAGRVVLATGAIEQPLMFGNNDLPGVMLAGAMHQYATRYAVLCGRRVIGLVNNDFGWQSILALHDAETTVPIIIDVRPEVADSLRTSAWERGIEVCTGAQPLLARGRRQVRALEFRDRGGQNRRVVCDGIAVSGGLSPTVHLFSQAGGRLRYDEAMGSFVPQAGPRTLQVVGAAAGTFADSDNCSIAPREPAPVASDRQWVDLLHDVTVSDLELAVRENYTSIEHLKRYTTTGMAVDQGKTSNLNALSVLGQLTNQKACEVGTTTFRPHFMPVTLGAIAGNRHGKLYAPARLLPAHDWHARRGAVFEEYGGWQRPAWYGGQREATIAREVRCVREHVGLFDGSPLGKIEVKGPDAAEFLNHVYVNTVPTLKPGRVRYGLMLNENGIVIDDGVFVRISDDHFIVNTTAGNADRIVAWLEEWHQCEWPEMELVISPVTSQWGVATVAGAQARELLQQLPGMIDLAADSFPHMGFGDGRFDGGTPYRIQRVSFSGELSFELSVPADQTAEYLERIMTLGEIYEIGLFGIEALLVLRMEKGFVHVGVDTDGTTNPFDLGFRRIVDNKRTDFIGARSLRRANDRSPDRRQLIGFELETGASPVAAGAHFVNGTGQARRSEGYVTSACLSPTLDKSVGLGLLERGFERHNQEVRIFDNGRETRGRIVNACFYDRSGGRVSG